MKKYILHNESKLCFWCRSPKSFCGKYQLGDNSRRCITSVREKRFPCLVYSLLTTAALKYSSAVTARNDEFKGSFHSSYSCLLNVKTWPRNSIIGLDAFRGETFSTFIAFTWPWRRTLTNGSDVKYVFPWLTEVTSKTYFRWPTEVTSITSFRGVG